MTKATAPQASLRDRAFSGGAWSIAGYGVGLMIRFGSNLVMTRLLVPEMFGVMSIAIVVMVGLAMFSDLGLRQNIVQSQRGSDPVFLNTVWVVQIIRGVVLWFVALGIALLVITANVARVVPEGSVYSDPLLPYVIMVLSIGTVISGFSSTKGAEASRNLSLGRLTQIEIFNQVAGFLCMLGWASVDCSIWALVAGSLCTQLFSVVLGHVLLPGTTNRWQWDRASALDIIQFGKWTFASSILGFLVSSGDRLLLGGLVDPAALGLYVIALLMFGAVEQALLRIVGTVVFPALSEVARNQGDMKKVYYQFHMVIGSIAYFSAGVLMVSGNALTGFLYDPRYAQAGWILELLAIVLMVTPFSIAIQSYLALGMPQLQSRILGVRLIAMYVAVPLGFNLYGLTGALWGIIISQFAGVPMFIRYNLRYGLLDMRREVAPLSAGLAGGVAGMLLSLLKH
jgi:O-antigen/teichoic acid export membrane protein